MTPVGTAMTIDVIIIGKSTTGARPDVNMWCVHTLMLRMAMPMLDPAIIR